MFKVLMVAAAVGLAGTTVAVAQAADRPSAAVVSTIVDWQAGLRAGTTQFSSAPGATCKPVVGTKASDRSCKLTISGKFTATDRGYKGTYSGTATINYLDPTTSNYAAFTSGIVTYKVYNLSGKLLGTVPMSIDLGSGGVFGFPYDLTVTYTYEERHTGDPDLVIRSEGTGLNQLDANLAPIRTFIDRMAFQ
ncbi:MAG: hypothetical protein JWN99_1831 [Ilumatobacteraceae bacterium]|nr:hypothetical protein [Ilumatobacteraceae bacterium]